VALETDGRHRLAKQELDSQLAILLERSQPEMVRGHRPKQVALGQVGALVWRLGLRPDQRDPALEASVT
jgi:hypothetical protein